MGLGEWLVRKEMRKEIVDAYKPYVELYWARCIPADKDAWLAKVCEDAPNGWLDAAVTAMMGSKPLITPDEFVNNIKQHINRDVSSQEKEMLELFSKLFACTGGCMGPADVGAAVVELLSTSCGVSCDHCSAPLLPLQDVGYRCKQCDPSSDSRFDLCSTCFSTSAAACPNHPGSACISGNTAAVSGTAPAPVAFIPEEAQRPGEPGAPAHSVPCMCCQEHHTIVLSYLRPDVCDLHMRPVLGTDEDTGDQVLAGWVCEFCAMRVCSKHTKRCMWWDPNHAAPGLCTQPYKCSTSWRGCVGLGDNPGFSVLEDVARVRTAAHCPTCAAKLDQGLKLWEPAPDGWSNPACSSLSHTPAQPQEAPQPAAASCSQQKTAPTPSSRAASKSRPRGGPGPAAGPGSARPKHLVIEHCFSCQEPHYVSNMGQVTGAYLTTGAHMQQLEDGRWVCELCSTAICSRCGDIGRTGEDATVAKWSQACYCDPKCKKVSSGGWHFDREALFAAAHDSNRVHCKFCRDKMLRKTLLDLNKGPKRPKAGAAFAKVAGTVVLKGTVAAAAALLSG